MMQTATDNDDCCAIDGQRVRTLFVTSLAIFWHRTALGALLRGVQGRVLSKRMNQVRIPTTGHASIGQTPGHESGVPTWQGCCDHLGSEALTRGITSRSMSGYRTLFVQIGRKLSVRAD